MTIARGTRSWFSALRRDGGLFALVGALLLIANVLQPLAEARAESTGKANTNKLAITGFCWGGRVTWLYSAHNPKVGAGVAWYGRLVGNETELTPQHPVDIAASLDVPVLGLYGGQDDGIPVSTVDQMREALKQGDSGSDIIVYPDAPHAFFADYRPSYRQADAEDAWRRLQGWFKWHGVA